MGILDSLINGAFNTYNAERQIAASKELQENAYNLTQKGYQESPGNLRKGLESAGYNPILAVNNSSAFSSGSYSASPGGATGNPASGIDESVANAYRIAKMEKPRNEAEIANMQAGTNATNASVSLINEQAKTEQYKQKNLETQSFLNDANRELAKKDLSWRDRLNLAEVKSKIIQAKAAHQLAEVGQLNAHTAQAEYNLRKGVTDYENVSRKAISDFYKKHPIQKNITTGIGEWTGAVGKVFSGSKKF